MADDPTSPHYPSTRPPPAAFPAGEPPPDDATPDVPGLEPLAPLGAGGMGVVWKVRQVSLKRVAALKMLLGGRYADPTARLRFLIEAEVVAAVRHPHVVAVYEFGQHQGHPYLLLEYVDGGSLADALRRRGAFPAAEAAGLVAKLADAIAAAHAQGVVHRDLKPANVLLTAAGEPKVADFGLAKVAGSDMTATGAVMGTPAYMAPEQAAGRVREAGTPADVWALGVILYELLTGRTPFATDSVIETLFRVVNEEPAAVRSIAPGTPRDLETICLKCLAKDPGKRYPTAAALAGDLRAYLAGDAITARPAGGLERAARWAVRHPTATTAAGLLLATAVGAVVLVGVLNRRAADRELEGRAAEVVKMLRRVETPRVPDILDDVQEVDGRADDRLRELAAAQPIDRKPGLHARLALLDREPDRAGELAAYVPVCRADEAGVIGRVLAPHAAAVAPPLWAVLEDPTTDPGRRLRAAAALAGLAPADPRWPAVAPGLVEPLVRANPLDAVWWGLALDPVGGTILPALLKWYAEAQPRVIDRQRPLDELVAAAAAREVAATLLARYAADRPAELAELAAEFDDRHRPLLAEPLAAKRAEVVDVLAARAADPDPARRDRAKAALETLRGRGR